MSVDLKSVKNIDERTNVVVFGYLRRIQHTSSISHTPELISSLCLCFYGRYIADYFKTAGKNIKIDKNGRVISNTNLLINSFHTAYGSKLINSSISRGYNTCYIWKFKIINQNGDIYIGMDCQGSLMNNNVVQKTAKPNYAYCSNGYKYSNNGSKKYLKPYDSNDLVLMKLDCGRLYFKHQTDALWRLAFSVANDNKLRMVITLKGGGTFGNYSKSSVELVDHWEFVNDAVEQIQKQAFTKRGVQRRNGQNKQIDIKYKEMKNKKNRRKRKKKKKEIVGTYYEEDIYDQCHGRYYKNPYYGGHRRYYKKKRSEYW